MISFSKLKCAIYIDSNASLYILINITKILLILGGTIQKAFKGHTIGDTLKWGVTSVERFMHCKLFPFIFVCIYVCFCMHGYFL